jgi:hypothetical protein
MANLLHFTEQFDDAYWSAVVVVVTANTHAAPAFAGINAGLADTIDDQSAGSSGALTGSYEDCPGDTSDFVVSRYVRKDAITSRFPILTMQFTSGATINTGVSLNTSTGATANANGLDAPDAIGCVDVDATWWRLWLRKANAGGVAVRSNFYPAYSATLGGAQDGAVTGSVIAWGANLTNTSTVQTYEPDPFYAFVIAEVPAALIFRNRLHV